MATEFTVAHVGGGEPLLQAGPVNRGQAAGALTGGQQLSTGLVFMTDPAEQLLQTDTAARETALQ